jgi:hypothetical protein
VSRDRPARATLAPTPDPDVAAAISITEAMRLARSDAAREILRAAGDRAIRRDGDEAATIGVMLILQAAVAVGVTQPRGTSSTPRWLVDFAEAQGVPADKIASYGATTRLASPRRGIMLREAASLAIRMAVALAKATTGRSRFDARHLIVAILDSPDRAVAQQMRRDALAIGLDLSALRRSLIERILETPEPEENVGIWLRFLETPGSAWAALGAPVREGPKSGAFPGFDADRASVSDEDPLGIASDVSAFARLICVEEATTPLSIGLFGEWGSGKSSFMERLQREIGHLTANERAARLRRATNPAISDAESEAGTRFVENVVQIRFNAWHYADANLWASLTAEFFDQLRRGGYDGQRDSNYLALIEKVAERVRSLEALAQKAQDKLSDAEGAAQRAEEALAAARKKLATSDLALASEQISSQFEAIKSDQDDRAKLREVGRRLYRDDLAADLDDFTATVSEAAHWPGKIALVARIIAGGGTERRLAVLAIVLVAFAGIGWHIVDQASAAVAVGRLLAWAGASLAAFRAVGGALKLAKPVLEGAWAYAKAVEKARKELAREVQDKEVESQQAASLLDEARHQARAAKAPLVNYGDAAAAGAPGTILRYFLFEDSDVREYDKHVGLVSRARRSFEQLDSIFSAARDGRDARDRRAAGLPLSEAQKRALARFEKMKLNQHALQIPDRIVLYIDDLDRCTHAQVYDVLQAIHLLLAFELFVVVVGVDVRWVEEAVARQFVIPVEDLPDSATREERDKARQRAEMARRKRAIDYLEKIFQLPFWLRPLATEGENASYAAYVRGLLAANHEAPVVPLSPEDATMRQDREAELEDDQEAESAADQRSDIDGFRAETDAETLDLALATVKLTPAEIDFLASPEIGALAAKSPRAVKRMVNVYRIVRARLDEVELAAFLGAGDEPPSWPIAAFLAAVECGQPVEVADDLYLGLKGVEPNRTLAEIADYDAEPFAPLDDGGFADLGPYEALDRVRKSCPALWAVNEGLRELRGGRTATCGEMLAMARTVRRYSFNRYH